MRLRDIIERIEARTRTGVMLRVLPGGAGAAEPEPEPEDPGDLDLAGGAREGKALRIGDTVEVNGLRLHRYDGSIEVVELANAGKRGKIVRNLDIIFHMRLDREAEEHFVAALVLAKGYDVALKLAQYAQGQAKAAGMDMGVHERPMRGVDVKPGAVAAGAEIKVEVPTFKLRASAVDFSVREYRLDGDQDTDAIIPPVGGAKKTAIKAFYAWVQASQAAIRKMDFRELGRAMADADLAYNRYSTMD